MDADRPANSFRLVDPKDLRPHEQVSLPHAIYLLLRLWWDGFLARPVLVDRATGVILDGHHRWWVSKRLGFSLIPCYLVDYLGDQSIDCLPRREEIPVSKELVLQKALAGSVFPPKTTKHRYDIPACEPTPLTALRTRRVASDSVVS